MPSCDHRMGYPAVISSLYEPDPSFVKFTPPRQRLTPAEEYYRSTADALDKVRRNAGLAPKAAEEEPAPSYNEGKNSCEYYLNATHYDYRDVHRRLMYTGFMREGRKYVHEWREGKWIRFGDWYKRSNSWLIPFPIERCTWNPNLGYFCAPQPE